MMMSKLTFCIEQGQSLLCNELDVEKQVEKDRSVGKEDCTTLLHCLEGKNLLL
jgi:hypothetical protein